MWQDKCRSQYFDEIFSDLTFSFFLNDSRCQALLFLFNVNNFHHCNTIDWSNFQKQLIREWWFWLLFFTWLDKFTLIWRISSGQHSLDAIQVWVWIIQSGPKFSLPYFNGRGKHFFVWLTVLSSKAWNRHLIKPFLSVSA